MIDEIQELIEMDPEKCRSIVLSLRMYIYFSEIAKNELKSERIKDIAYMRDPSSKALYLSSQIGPDDEN